MGAILRGTAGKSIVEAGFRERRGEKRAFRRSGHRFAARKAR
jgi:hypothetical protein